MMDTERTAVNQRSVEPTTLESGKVRAVLPLNSKQLRATLLRKIAQAICLPTNVSTEQLHQLINAKLIGMGKELTNVQVLVAGATDIPALQDEGGVFVDATDVGSEGGPTLGEGEDVLYPEDHAGLEGDAESLE